MAALAVRKPHVWGKREEGGAGKRARERRRTKKRSKTLKTVSLYLWEKKL